MKSCHRTGYNFPFFINSRWPVLFAHRTGIGVTKLKPPSSAAAILFTVTPLLNYKFSHVPYCSGMRDRLERLKGRLFSQVNI